MRQGAAVVLARKPFQAAATETAPDNSTGKPGFRREPPNAAVSAQRLQSGKQQGKWRDARMKDIKVGFIGLGGRGQ